MENSLDRTFSQHSHGEERFQSVLQSDHICIVWLLEAFGQQEGSRRQDTAT